MATVEKVELWCGAKIPVIVLSGEIHAGKSLFPLFIDPVCRIPRDKAEPTTIVFDQEGSVEPYSGSVNFKWFDTRRAVFDGVHRKTVAVSPNDPKWLHILKTKADVNDSPAASMFRAAYLSMLAIEPGKYRVMSWDTFTPIQEGMVEWLRKHPEAFGRTSGQYEKASSMFLWPDVKAMLGHILAVDCRLRFETVCLLAHMKAKWEGDRKTKERIAEGLDVLDKLATLHIQLERAPDASGKVPKEPVGILKKSRLLRFGATPGDDMPILPPRIEKCTPDTIRAFIQKPADYSKLKKSERVVVAQPTEIELQQLRLATAEAESEAAMAKTTLLDRQRELTAIRNAAQANPQTVATVVRQEMSQQAQQDDADIAAAQAQLAATQAEGERLAAAAEPEHQKTAAAATTTTPPTVPADRVERFKALLPASGLTPDKLKAAFAARGAQRFTELQPPAQDEVLEWMDNLANCHALIKALGLDDAKVKQICAQANVETVADLNGPLALALRSKLQSAHNVRTAQAQSTDQPKN